jgi:hypothetical protein
LWKCVKSMILWWCWGMDTCDWIFKFMLHFLEHFLNKVKWKTGILITALLFLKDRAAGSYNNMMDGNLNNKANWKISSPLAKAKFKLSIILLF